MKFIVIEGLDGSGKSTQLNLLKNYFSKSGISFKYLHFPRTNKRYFGELIAMFLRGDFGNLNQVNPYLVAMLYAGDRHDTKESIQNWLKDHYVIVDRYVYSNLAFQCAKIDKHKKRLELRNWILDLEFDYFKIPKPDISLFLDVPFDFTRKKLTQTRAGDDRDYLQGKTDIHEDSISFQEMVRAEYLELLNDQDKFFAINCISEKGTMLPENEIFNNILVKLNEHKIVSINNI